MWVHSCCNIGITPVFSCPNIYWSPRNSLKHKNEFVQRLLLNNMVFLTKRWNLILNDASVVFCINYSNNGCTKENILNHVSNLPGTMDMVLRTLKTRKVLMPCRLPRLDWPPLCSSAIVTTADMMTIKSSQFHASLK